MQRSNLTLDLTLLSGIRNQFEIWKYKPLIGGDIKVLETATKIYVQSNIDPIVGADSVTYDKVQFGVTRYARRALNWTNEFTRIQPHGAAISSTTGTCSINSLTDAAAPLHIAGSYIGGNHGWAFLYKITSSGGHGLTYGDIGTRFQNAGNDYYLVMLDAANPTTIAYFAPPNTGNATAWTFVQRAIASGQSLVQQTANPKTVVMTSAAAVASMLTLITDVNTNESINNHIYSVLIDGVTPAAVDTIHTCKYCVIEEQYNICNFNTELEYIIANAGTFASNPLWNYTLPAVTVKNWYIYEDYGCFKTYQEVICHLDLVFGGTGYIGGLQAPYLATTGATVSSLLGTTAPVLKVYAPNIDPDAGLVFGANIATYVNTTHKFVNNDLLDKTKAADRVVMIGQSTELPNGGYGRVLGYQQLYSESDRIKRIHNTSVYYGNNSGSGKIYMQAYNTLLDSENLTRTFKLYNYYKVFKPKAYGSGQVYWVNYMNVCIVYIDYHAMVTEEVIALPDMFTGKTYTILEQSVNMTGCVGVLPNIVITTTDSNYANAIIKVS